MNFMLLAERIISGHSITDEEALNFLESDDLQMPEMIAGASRIRNRFFSKNVSIQVLKNAKSGNCSEDCGYCSQSSVSHADIRRFGLVHEDDIVNGSLDAKKINAKRYCMALSGGHATDGEIDILCRAVGRIRNSGNLETCCSIGFLTFEQAAKLKSAGLNRVNHNLNTSRKYYSEICSTHSFQDRIDNIRRCRQAGLEICSGGIIGQGESSIDVIEFFRELAAIRPDSVPVNFFIPVKGTPFASLPQKLTPVKCLKILSLARYMLPDTEIRLAGGREYHLRTMQPLAFFAVNSVFVRGYLTAGGAGEDETLKMIADAGFDFSAC